MINPSPNQSFYVGNDKYRFTSIPDHSSVVYREVGRKAEVYRLDRNDGKQYALKVFFPIFRDYRILLISNALEQLKMLSGMALAERLVITHDNNPNLISEYPDLEFAVLMPWINSNPWINYLARNDVVFPSKTWQTAKNLCNTLFELEVRELAHTDLSGSNLLVDNINSSVSLVGLESMYGHLFPKPEHLSGGTPGYAHPISFRSGQWCKEGDRFSAAVLFAEILTIQNNTIRRKSYGESYFSQSEIGIDCERFTLMCSELHNIDPALKEIFEKAWFSTDFIECPSIRMWKDIFSKEHHLAD